MQLRLPITIGVVALAAAAALLRGHGTAPSFSIASNPGAASPAPADVFDSQNGLRSRATRLGPTPKGFLPSQNGLGSARPRVGRASDRTEATIVVYVAGEVARAGLYTLPLQSRAADAVRAAGGARPDADLVAINLAAPLADGDEVAVAALGADVTTTATSAKTTRGRRHRRRRASVGSEIIGSDSGDVTPPKRHRKKRHRRHRPATAAAANPASNAGGDGTSNRPVADLSDGSTDIVDLSNADASELETLPGIGPTLAARIVTFRELNGPFASPDDLLDVGGMTQGKLDALLPYVVVR